MDSILQIKDIAKSFGKRIVLDGINLEIQRGEIFGIIGMSGSGKTTLLNTIVGYFQPDRGDVLFFSKKDECYKSVYIAQIEAKRLFGFAPQKPSFYPKLTVAENLEHWGSLYGIPKAIRDRNIKNLLEFSSLTEFKDMVAQDLSGGMARRLSIACSIIHRPSILFLDEPTADLDPIMRKEIWTLVKAIKNIGTTVLVASHFLSELEEICDRIAILHNSKITAAGHPEHIKEAYSENEEIVIESKPGRYTLLAKTLAKSIRSIKGFELRGNKLIVYVSDAKRIVSKVIAIAKKCRERIIDIQLGKPSLVEVFEKLYAK